MRPTGSPCARSCPAATAVVTVRPEHVPDGAPAEVTVATVLPMAWPGLHRTDGTVLIGTQSGNASGDASRDLAGQLLAALAAEPGHPVLTTPQVTADSPRLQDVLTDDGAFEVTVHEGFDFWVEGQELEGDAAESLERANSSVVPTARMSALPSAYWVRIGERAHIRLVLPDDEDAATDALVPPARRRRRRPRRRHPPARRLPRLRAARARVGPRPRARGRPTTRPSSPRGASGTPWPWRPTPPLTAEERRARSGLLSRQVTLR